jgi:hypothetical protein
MAVRMQMPVACVSSGRGRSCERSVQLTHAAGAVGWERQRLAALVAEPRDGATFVGCPRNRP